MKVLDVIPDGGKHAMDWLSFATAIGTLAQWLPSLAALLTVIWSALRIYDRLRFGPHRARD